jgi:hypothetical protein
MAAAACDNLEVVLKMLSLVEDLSRKSVLVSQTLAHAAKHGSHGVCEGIVEMWPKHNLSAALFCSAQVCKGVVSLFLTFVVLVILSRTCKIQQMFRPTLSQH